MRVLDKPLLRPIKLARIVYCVSALSRRALLYFSIYVLVPELDRIDRLAESERSEKARVSIYVLWYNCTGRVCAPGELVSSV